MACMTPFSGGIFVEMKGFYFVVLLVRKGLRWMKAEIGEQEIEE